MQRQNTWYGPMTIDKFISYNTHKYNSIRGHE